MDFLKPKSKAKLKSLKQRAALLAAGDAETMAEERERKKPTFKTSEYHIPNRAKQLKSLRTRIGKKKGFEELALRLTGMIGRLTNWKVEHSDTQELLDESESLMYNARTALNPKFLPKGVKKTKKTGIGALYTRAAIIDAGEKALAGTGIINDNEYAARARAEWAEHDDYDALRVQLDKATREIEESLSADLPTGDMITAGMLTHMYINVRTLAERVDQIRAERAGEPEPERKFDNEDDDLRDEAEETVRSIHTAQAPKPLGPRGKKLVAILQALLLRAKDQNPIPAKLVRELEKAINKGNNYSGEDIDEEEEDVDITTVPPLPPPTIPPPTLAANFGPPYPKAPKPPTPAKIPTPKPPTPKPPTPLPMEEAIGHVEAGPRAYQHAAVNRELLGRLTPRHARNEVTKMVEDDEGPSWLAEMHGNIIRVAGGHRYDMGWLKAEKVRTRARIADLEWPDGQEAESVEQYRAFAEELLKDATLQRYIDVHNEAPEEYTLAAADRAAHNAIENPTAEDKKRNDIRLNTFRRMSITILKIQYRKYQKFIQKNGRSFPTSNEKMFDTMVTMIEHRLQAKQVLDERGEEVEEKEVEEKDEVPHPTGGRYTIAMVKRHAKMVLERDASAELLDQMDEEQRTLARMTREELLDNITELATWRLRNLDNFPTMNHLLFERMIMNNVARQLVQDLLDRMGGDEPPDDDEEETEEENEYPSGRPRNVRKRCAAIKRGGGQCRNITIKYARYCYAHTAYANSVGGGLKIKESTLAGRPAQRTKAGNMGLFANKEFEKGDIVARVKGPLARGRPKRWDIGTTAAHRINASSTQAGLGRWPQDVLPQQRSALRHNNVKVLPVAGKPRRFQLQAREDIEPGMEIYANRGAGYWGRPPEWDRKRRRDDEAVVQRVIRGRH